MPVADACIPPTVNFGLPAVKPAAPVFNPHVELYLGDRRKPRGLDYTPRTYVRVRNFIPFPATIPNRHPVAIHKILHTPLVSEVVFGQESSRVALPVRKQGPGRRSAPLLLLPTRRKHSRPRPHPHPFSLRSRRPPCACAVAGATTTITTAAAASATDASGSCR